MWPKGIHRVVAQERVVFGEPAAEAMRAEAERIGASRLFVISTASVKASGLLDQFVADLGDLGVGSYHGVTAHGPRPCVIEGANAAREAGADLLVALGGGSAIDAARAMLFAIWYDIRDVDGFDAHTSLAGKDPSRWKSDGDLSPRMVAIPTTLSAAEFNWFGGVSDPRRGVKEPVGNALSVPQSVILDPAMTLATPTDLLLSTGIKAVDHAVERLCSVRPQPFSDATAIHALKLLAPNLLKVRDQPHDMAARMDLQFGMWLSISGLQAGVPLGASHGIGHVLGAHAKVPHGVTSCVMLPAVLEWNLPANPAQQAMVSAAMGQPETPAARIVRDLVASLGQPNRLRDVGVTRDDFQPIADKAQDDHMIHTNPRKVGGPDGIKEILEIAW